MKDKHKTKVKLTKESDALHQCIAKLETLEVKCKKAEDALCKLEEKYGCLIEETSIGLCNVDIKGKVTYVNKRFEEVSGYPREEIVGKSGFKLGMFPRESLDIFAKRIKERLMGKTARRMETPFKCKNGRWIWVEIEVKIIKERGIPVGFQLTSREITKRKRAEEALQHRVEFESLITRMSAGFINLTPDEVDSVLEHALQIIGEFAGIDRSYVFLFSDDGTKMDNTHEWCAKGIEPQIENLKGVPSESLPWFVDKLNRSETVHIPRVADLPPEASAEKEILESQDIQSLIIVPMVYGRDLLGFLGFDSVRMEKTWSEDIISLLKKVGEIFSNALEHKRTEEELKQSEKRYKDLVEKAGVSILIDDKEGNFKYFNEKFTELFGYSVKEMRKQSIRSLVHPEDIERVIKFHKERVQGKRVPSRYQFRGVKKDGSTIYLEVEAVVLRERASIIGIRSYIWDISKRVQKEEEIQLQRKRLESFVQYSQLGIVTVDMNSKIISCNPTFEEIFQYKESEILGRDVDELVAGKELIKEARAVTKKAIINGNPSKITTKRKRKDGTWFDVEVFAVPIKISDKLVGQFGIYLDITKRKRAEKELRSSREQLRNLALHLQSVREEERVSIAREIHDELGQMMTALKIDLSWLNNRLPKNQKSLYRKTKAMLKIVDLTIQTGKRISTELRPSLLDDLGLPAAIEWQAKEFQNQAEIKVEVTINPEYIMLDKDRSTAIFRIFQETLTNVARHADATRVKVSLREKAGKLELKVRDNGKGITEKQISDPKSFGIIGIRERVHPWGGEVKIRGVRNKGTTVTVSINLQKK
ncbi:PAS domain S-box protein [candidate division WOR-3 bacterium]|nr:PAS domain S-box protein [candidate division WOR-3 bacterium]